MDTYWALIVPAIPHAFGIFWMRQYFLAASTVAIIPTLTLYFVLQRFIVRSIKMTGLKG